MKAGDKVKVIGIPPDVRNRDELRTRSLFEKCLGKTFEVARVESVEGLNQPLAVLHVGRVIGKAPDAEWIWVEEQYLQTQEPS